MIRRLELRRFDGVVGNGRTRPCRFTAIDQDGNEHEVIVKFSAGCNLGVDALMMETVTACLAGAFKLPIPEPFFVEVDPVWANFVPDPEVADIIGNSNPVAFGSKYVGQGYSIWSPGVILPEDQLETALGVFFFDAVLQNSDRRLGNPNCLVKGDQIRIIDHEACFSIPGVVQVILGWQAPWTLGAMDIYKDGPLKHILFQHIQGKDLCYNALEAGWKSLNVAQLDVYQGALPPEWLGKCHKINEVFNHIQAVMQNIDACLVEAKRVLV